MKNWFAKNKWKILLSVGATFLPTLIGLILWNQLPDTMNSHWGVDGAADGSASKAFAVFGMPAILAAANLLCMVATGLDRGNRDQNKKLMGIIFWIMPVISLAVMGGMYAIALGKPVDMMLIVPVLMGVLFIVLGNYMPKATQNRTMGIKIYWTLCNEENWNKTHRFAGKCWVAGGLVVLLEAVLPLSWFVPVMLTTIALLVIAPVVYSYIIYRQHKAQGIEYKAPPATKGQKWVKWLSLAAVLAILVLVAVLMFTGDIGYTCGESALRIEADYYSGLEVSYEEMEEIRLLEDFDMGVRTMGYGSFRLSMGAFQNEELGEYTLYAYNSCDSVILIRNGENYLAINALTEAETQALYKSLLEKVGG